MKPYALHLGDCIEVMRGLPENSVDAVVTDPPYGIRFMGKAWDGADIEARAERRRTFASHAPDAGPNGGPNGGHKSIAAEAGKYDLAPAAMRAFQEFSEEWAREAFRVLKPGGHLLSFSSARTYHRMACGIEDAGFEVRDQALWLYGSGFPKSRDLSKMDFAGTPEAEQWAGWGTALKPAHEPICVARKPLAKGCTVAANVLQFGTGALNIDGCKVGEDSTRRATLRVMSSRGAPGGSFAAQDHRYADRSSSYPTGSDAGRWPANLIHDGSPEVVALFPQSTSGAVKAGTVGGHSKGREVYGEHAGYQIGGIEASTGSAARFFYCAKASRADRNEGLADPGPQFKHGSTLRDAENLNAGGPRAGNHHPTVKPTDLMAYLCRLVTPPGGVVLDPFMGSGTTGKAAIREGFRFIGAELEPDYMAIAAARIEHELAQVEAAAAAPAPSPQLDLFKEAS
jgi:site-specific DNA-methyltransferase (adenine-specific)